MAGLVDLDLQVIDLVVLLDHLGAELIVAVEQRLRGLGDHALHHAAHLEQSLAYPVEILIQSSFHVTFPFRQASYPFAPCRSVT